MDKWIKFKDNSFEDEGELMLGMKELRQRKKELKVTDNKWDAVWMLTIIKKRKKIDKYIFQALRDIVKQGGDDVIKSLKIYLNNLESKDVTKMVNLHIQSSTQKTRKGWKKTLKMRKGWKKTLILLTRLRQRRQCL